MFRRTRKMAHDAPNTALDTVLDIAPKTASETVPEEIRKGRQRDGKTAKPVRTRPELNRKDPSRRDFLKLTGVTIVAASLEACQRVDTAEPLAVSGELPGNRGADRQAVSRRALYPDQAATR